MIKNISKTKAQAFLDGGKFKRIVDNINGLGDNADIKHVLIEPHATYFRWANTEDGNDYGNCYWADVDKIEAVYNDYGFITRVVFKYNNKFMIIYEKD